MFYYLYQITNNLNGKIYVGVHKTKDMNDGYMGSGKVIRAAIEKYGIENFTKVILERFEDAAAMYAKEKEIVNDEFLLREDTYNLRRGGTGGFDYINGNGLNQANGSPFAKPGVNAELSRRKVEKLKQNPELRRAYKHRKFTNDEIRKGHIAALSEEAKVKRRNTFSMIGHSQGSKNSQFGTMWITNGEFSKKIRINEEMPDGWTKGRSKGHN